MIKRKIVEVVEEYNDSGKLTRKTTTETTEDDNSVTHTTPYQWWTYPDFPTITRNAGQTADSPLPRDVTVVCNTMDSSNNT